MSLVIFRAPIISRQIIDPRPKAIHFEPPNLLLTTLAPTTPFKNWDVVLPKARLPKVAAFDPPNLRFSTLFPTIPFKNWDWVLPKPRLPKVAAFDPPDLILNTLAPTVPFKNWDWIVPKPRLPEAPSFDPPNLLATAVIPAPIVNPLDQPIARQMPKAQASDQPNILVALLVQPPFVNLDLSLPQGRGRSPAQDIPYNLSLYAPPAPPAPPPQVGGHWLPPSASELARQNRLAAEARREQEERWAARVREQEELHRQILALLHPDRVEKEMAVKLPPKTASVSYDEDEDDFEILFLNG